MSKIEMNVRPKETFYFVVDKGLDVDKFLPQRSEYNDTGYDVACAEKEVVLRPYDKAIISLGIRVFAPKGWWLELRPRSSTFAKKHLNPLYGVIDESYEGHLKLCVQYIPPPTSDYNSGSLARYISVKEQPNFTIKFGEKIAQLVPVQRESMHAVPISEERFAEFCKNRGDNRGTGGFGSTGD